MSRESIYSAHSEFQTMASRPTFIDKTLMIRHVLEGPETILITAPRRFGKSTNLDMLKQFLGIPLNAADSEKRLQMFQRLNIYKDSPEFVNRTFGRYPVLHVDFKSIVPVTDYDIAIKMLANKVHNSFYEHRYLKHSEKLSEKERHKCELWSDDESYLDITPWEVIIGLQQLVNFLFKYYNRRVFVLIDEYDAGITNAMFKVSDKDLILIIELFTFQISNLIKSNTHVERAVVTGISYIAGTELSSLNNIDVYTFLNIHPFVDFYGFTEREVHYLFTKFNVSDAQAAEATDWYDGYVCEGGHRIFNPFSILNFLQYGTIKNYWKNNGRVDSLFNAFACPSIKKNIIKMLRNESKEIDPVLYLSINDMLSLKNLSCSCSIEQSDTIEDLFFSFLFEQGYLTFAGPTKPNHVSIPNLEIKTIFSLKLRNSIAGVYKINRQLMRMCAGFFDKLNYQSKSTDVTFVREVTEFQSNLEKLSWSFRKRNHNNVLTNEACFEHDIFSVLLICNDFRINSQLYCQYNDSNGLRNSRLDLYMTKNNFGVIIELKHSRGRKANSTIALRQILEMKYDNVFEMRKYTPQKIEYKLLVGLSVNNKGNVSVSCLLNTRNEAYTVTVPRITPSFLH